MGVGGAFIVVTADDPSCHSSQNEQDNRHYARAARSPWWSSDAQECKDFVALACEVSELPPPPDLTRQGPAGPHHHPCVPANVRKFGPRPVFWWRSGWRSCGNCTGSEQKAGEMGDGRVGVITASIAYEYAKEVFPEGTSFLKLGLTFPLPNGPDPTCLQGGEALRHRGAGALYGGPDQGRRHPLRGQGADGAFRKIYELNTQLLRQRVLGQKADYRTVDVAPANRPPALCPGCPHRGFFYTLSKNKNYVVTGDIGCYTLGCAAPLNCMGLRGMHGRGLLRRYGHRQEL